MNSKLIEKLEFDKIQARLADMAYFEGGKRKALGSIISTDYVTILGLLDQTAEAMELTRFYDFGFLYGLKLIDAPLRKINLGGILTGSELRDIHDLLRSSRMVRKILGKRPSPRLDVLNSQLIDNYDLEARINRTVDEEGQIRDGASAALREIRDRISKTRSRIRDYLQNFIRASNNQKILQDALITERDGRYVVPVKQEYKNEVKGVVHDESASGATVFIEPLQVLEDNNLIRSLQREEAKEIEKILKELTSQITVISSELSANQECLSQLDLILARAKMALKLNAYRPDLNQSGIIEINRGKHPLLGEGAVPLNVKLGEEYNLLVITGPNTGGKTVALKTIGLMTLMAMSGMFIPARENSRISVFKSVFIDIGDEQSIEQSLSTFSSHMTNIIQILNKVDQNSLVLIDELGAGTDPSEGAALATVILETLLKKGAKAVVTTHQSELKAFAYQNDKVENACVEFDPVSLQPTYELTIGMPGQSNAFEIALRLGLDPELVGRAKKLVPQGQAEIGNMIKQLKESRDYYSSLSREVERLKNELEKEKQLFEEQTKNTLLEHDRLMQKQKREMELYIKSIKTEADTAIKELKSLLKDKQTLPKWHEIEKARKKIKDLNVDSIYNDQQSAMAPSEPIRPGDSVYIRGIEQTGYVVEEPNSQGEVLVQVGLLRVSVNRNQVYKYESREEKLTRYKNQTFLEKAKSISKEIDVRGKSAEEALIDIEKYLEDANLVGLNSVYIIHGKGTGVLRKAVRNYLKDHSYVKSFRDGNREEGSYGVTVVELKN
ncbi:MAG: endonuclease MutS2 [Syntrophomonadaceae bacterium]|nr:endonuclease MutS2 [Syntrophomonadaceae bacterium]